MKKNVLINIDTSSTQKTSVSLVFDGKTHTLTTVGIQKSQNVIPMIEGLLKRLKISKEDITAIEVNLGPGSFTGLRVGIAVARTLAFLLEIPINHQEATLTLTPKYQNSKFS